MILRSTAQILIIVLSILMIDALLLIWVGLLFLVEDPTLLRNTFFVVLLTVNSRSDVVSFLLLCILKYLRNSNNKEVQFFMIALILSRGRRRYNLLHYGGVDMGNGHLNFALGAGALPVIHFLLLPFTRHINFRNGAGNLYFAMYFITPR